VRFADFLARLITGHRGWIVVFLLAMTALSAYGFFSRRTPVIDTENNRAQVDISQLRSEDTDYGFSAVDCLIVVEIEDLYSRDTVVSLRRMVDRLEQLPYIATVIWADRVPMLNMFGLAEPLFPPPDASAGRFRAARQRAEAHPLVHGQLISADASTLLMPVTFDWVHVKDDEDCTVELLRVAREAVADQADIRVRITGRVPLYVGYQQALDHNQMKYFAISFGLIVVLAMILFRGIKAVLIVTAAPILGVCWTLGIVNLMDALSNPLTAVVLPVLLSMIGLTDGIHIMVHIRRRRAEGMEPLPAARSAIEEVGLACALTSLTTAVGFASLMLASNNFVSEFGQSCAIGVGITFMAVVTVIPLLCSTWIGKNIHLGQELDLIGRGMRHAGGFMDFVLRWSRPITIGGILVTLLFASTLFTLRPDELTSDGQPEDSEVYQALAHCDRTFGGIEFAQAIIKWDDSVDSQSPQILEAIADVEQIIADESLLNYPLSLHDLLGAFPQQGDDPARQMTFISLLPPPIRNAFYSKVKQESVVTMRIEDLGIAKYQPVFQRVTEQFSRLENSHPGFTFNLAGEPVRRSKVIYQIVIDLVRSLGTAAVIIFIVLTLVYRSLRLGLLTIIPNMFPLMFTGAVLAVTGQPLNVAAVCSFTVCLGIAVDDTIHFLTRYQVERRNGHGVEESLRRSFTTVGTVLVTTTLILVAGFSTVLFSDLAGHRAFALMAVCTIASALVGDLLLLPAMLNWFRGKEDEGRRQDLDVTD
jgi:predicted RND superfamily exporter protein